MTNVLMPDVEYVIWDIISHDVTLSPPITLLVGDRIYKAQLPPKPVGPLIKITRIGGQAIIPEFNVFDESRVQFDCYGGSQRDANRLAETLRNQLALLRSFLHNDGQIVYAKPDPPVYIPDPTWTTDRGGPKPRYLFDALIGSKLAG